MIFCSPETKLEDRWILFILILLHELFCLLEFQTSSILSQVFPSTLTLGSSGNNPIVTYFGDLSFWCRFQGLTHKMYCTKLSSWKSEVTQSCPTLRDPMDCSLPGSSVHGISQARILECVAISFSRGSSQSRDWTWVFRTAGRLFTILSHQEKIPVNVKSSPFVGYYAGGGVFEETTSLPLLPCWCGPIILCCGADVQLGLPW